MKSVYIIRATGIYRHDKHENGMQQFHKQFNMHFTQS